MAREAESFIAPPSAMPVSCPSCIVHQLVHGQYALRQCRDRQLLTQVKPEEIELVRRDYSANGGWESFLAYEDPRQDILVGLLRLRKVSGAAKARQPELQGRCSIVRELHVYGTAVAVSARDATKQQHQVSLHTCLLHHCPIAFCTENVYLLCHVLNGRFGLYQ